MTLVQGDVLTVTRGQQTMFTVRGFIGQIVTNLILNTDGTGLLTQAGDLLIY